MDLNQKCERIRELLKEYGLNYNWLMRELKVKYGIIACRSEISDFLCGRRHAAKADDVINASLLLLNDYGEKYA